MKKQSVKELKQLFANEEINEDLIEVLRSDERKGVQDLLKKHERKKQQQQQLEEKFNKMMWYEQKEYMNGSRYIAGIDEAGRGPLAGPVVAAAVILPDDFKLLGINDSKQLNEAARETFFETIKEQAISYGISVIGNEKIDEVNIFEATKVAMHNALKQLEIEPHHVLIDAVHLRGLPCTSEVITKADQKSVTVAAASILAKVTRDRLMKEIHSTYPWYDFMSNMGYGTKHHMTMLMEHGATPYHRRSFAPVRDAVNRQPAN